MVAVLGSPGLPPLSSPLPRLGTPRGQRLRTLLLPLRPSVCLEHSFTQHLATSKAQRQSSSLLPNSARECPAVSVVTAGVCSQAGGEAMGQVSAGGGRGGWSPPPGAEHPPCPCASAGCAGQTPDSSVSSSTASGAPQGPAGHKPRVQVLAAACALCPGLLESHALPDSNPRRSPCSQEPPLAPLQSTYPRAGMTPHLAGMPASLGAHVLSVSHASGGQTRKPGSWDLNPGRLDFTATLFIS